MRIAATLLSMAVALTLASTGLAAGFGGSGCCEKEPACGPVGCCHECGTRTSATKECQVVCDVKKVKKTVWVVECEEFCIPAPNCGRDCGSCKSCEEKCEAEACDSSCGKDPCKALRDRKYVPPKCGKVRCRKKLVKKEVTCEIPIYKCVVVNCCDSCGGEEVEEAIADEAPLPAPGEAAPAPPPVPDHSTRTAPKSRVIGTSYLQELKFDR